MHVEEAVQGTDLLTLALRSQDTISPSDEQDKKPAEQQVAAAATLAQQTATADATTAVVPPQVVPNVPLQESPAPRTHAKPQPTSTEYSIENAGNIAVNSPNRALAGIAFFGILLISGAIFTIGSAFRRD